MSICQHVTEYDNGTVKDHGSSGDELMDIETCLRRMLYHDVIDTSAWAKLYHRSLFDTVCYPVGKIFEDIGTTYALMMQCDAGIAVGYASKYHYMYHMNSIVNSSFSPRKLDLLEMTDKMGHEVIKAYPSLRQAVLRRRVYARFRILKDPRAPRRDKIAIRLLSVSYGLYKAFWRTYQGAIFKKN